MMHGGINVTENLEEEKNSLNNDKPEINRGVELLRKESISAFVVLRYFKNS